MKKILFSFLALCLLTGCGEKENKVSENGIQELNLNDEVVEKIVLKFRMETNDSVLTTYGQISEGIIYEDEELTEVDLLSLARLNSLDLVKKDMRCDGSKYDNDDEGYYYQCRYIEYDDFNRAYSSLTGRDLPKEDIQIDLYMFIYDEQSNVYRECMYYGGGGTSLVLASKIEKAEKEDDYIYIYEKVAFIWPNSDYSEYNIISRDNKVTNIGHSTSIKEKAISNYLDSFDTYKWTFKKSDSGEYVYESLKYVEE